MKTLKENRYFFDYFLFVALMSFKLYLFATYANLFFYRDGLIEYAKRTFNFIFLGQPIHTLLAGVVMVSVGSVIILSFWTLLLNNIKRYSVLLILNFLLTFIIYADLVHFRYFDSLVSISVLGQIGQLGDVNESVLALTKISDIIFWLDIIIFAIIYVYLKKKKVSFNERNNWKIKFSFVIIFFVIGNFLILKPINALKNNGADEVFAKMMNSEIVYNHAGLLGFHYYDIKKNIAVAKLNNKKLTESEKEEIKDWFDNKKDDVNSPSFGVAKGSNIIIVQVEALQNYMLDAKINNQEITPFLNKLKKEVNYVPDFYFQTNQGKTADADFLVNASLYSLSEGVAFVSYDNNSYDNLAKILKNERYSTQAHHAFKGSFWNRHIMYRNFRYDTFFDKDDYKEGKVFGMGLNDKDFLLQSIEQDVNKTNQPFYSFNITLSSHYPFNIKEEEKLLDLPKEKDQLFYNYLQNIHLLDKALESFVGKLKEEGLWEKSIVVFYGDHDGSWIPSEDKEVWKDLGIESDFEYQKRAKQIPLIMHVPNLKENSIEKIGGQIDITPTILHLLGIKREGLVLMGDNLFDSKENLTIVRRTNNFTDGKYWYSPSEDGKFENGICVNYDDGAKTDINNCKANYEETEKRLKISDAIIHGNLIEKLKDKD